jgi:hypothetical protein
MLDAVVALDRAVAATLRRACAQRSSVRDPTCERGSAIVAPA